METRSFSVELAGTADPAARLRELTECHGWQVVGIEASFAASADSPLARFLMLTARGEDLAAFTAAMRSEPDIVDLVPEAPVEPIRPPGSGR